MSLCLQHVQLHPLVFPVFVIHACEFVPVQQVPTVPFQSPISLVLSHTLPSYHSLPFPNELSFPSRPYRSSSTGATSSVSSPKSLIKRFCRSGLVNPLISCPLLVNCTPSSSTVMSRMESKVKPAVAILHPQKCPKMQTKLSMLSNALPSRQR